VKTLKCISLFIFASFLVIACQKSPNPPSVPVRFTSTTYANLGTWDNSGKPGYLLSPDVISDGLKSYLRTNLPEHKDLSSIHPEWLTNPEIGDIAITQSSDVYITFVSQGALYANAFGFYTYTTGHSPTTAKDIEKITYIFPNVGRGTPLKAGDKVKLGRFDTGTSIGFVIMQNAWDTTTHTLTTDIPHFCSNDVLNPEVNPNLKKHAVLVNYAPESKILIGFEDWDRTVSGCDNDFNDIVTYATVVH
jgi:hypothetical protein